MHMMTCQIFNDRSKHQRCYTYVHQGSNETLKDILLHVHSINDMGDLQVWPIRQILKEDRLFLERYAFDKRCASISVHPIQILLSIDDAYVFHHFVHVFSVMTSLRRGFNLWDVVIKSK